MYSIYVNHRGGPHGLPCLHDQYEHYNPQRHGPCQRVWGCTRFRRRQKRVPILRVTVELQLLASCRCQREEHHVLRPCRLCHEPEQILHFAPRKGYARYLKSNIHWLPKRGGQSDCDSKPNPLSGLVQASFAAQNPNHLAGNPQIIDYFISNDQKFREYVLA